jgi:hypothetical protein
LEKRCCEYMPRMDPLKGKKGNVEKPSSYVDDTGLVYILFMMMKDLWKRSENESNVMTKFVEMKRVAKIINEVAGIKNSLLRVSSSCSILPRYRTRR